MKAPPGGFNDSALTQIFQKTIPRIKDAALNTTTPSSKTNSTNGASGTGGQSPASSPSSSTPVGAIAGGVVGGVAVLAIAGALLYVFYFRRRRREKQAAAAAVANQWGNPELSTHASVSRNRHKVHEVHGDHRPNEIDGNGFVEAPAGDPARPSPVFEMASSNH